MEGYLVYSSARVKTIQIKIIYATNTRVSSVRSQRINDNISTSNQENTRSIEEHLQVISSELEIIKQDFERKSLELEKRIEQYEEEKMQLGMDVDDLDSLKMDYKKLRLSIKTAGLAREDVLQGSLVENQNENVGLKIRVLELERFLHQYRSRNSVRDRDYIMGAALTQVREVVDRLQTLAVQADVLSLKYESESDQGQELAWLLRKVGTSTPTSFPIGLGFNPGNNPTNPVVPNLDDIAEIEKAIVELPKQLEGQCRWLEEKFKALESADYHGGIDAKDLSMVPDLVLPPKFKTPEFEKYNRTSCPEAHITMFYRRITGYVNNDQLLIHCFQDNLTRAAAK
ncbi:hypothetical protein Goklo_005110 [Gossypium klotzschianum]|uniref:Uncharacterized protein n=1 Tax=Gossypium klotzschianum TaxID=34286 RepID=A0A7J8VR27_9ROSI|nr:hypothetical protein [Gossypium klotzschianum]